VAPRPLRAPGGAAQRGDRRGLPVLLLRRPPPRREPPARGRRPRPRQRHRAGGRRAPRDRRARRLHPADPFGPPSGGSRAGAHLPHQSVDPGPEPRLTRGHRAGCRPRLPPADPVGGLGRRHRLRPRDPGDRLGGGPQRDLLVRARRLPGRTRVPCPVRSRRARLRVGLDPGRGGRRGRGAPARGIRRALLAAHTRPGAGEQDHPARSRPAPLPRPRPDHQPGRTPGPAVRGPHGRSRPAPAGSGLGCGQLATRRRLALGVRGSVRARDLADRPAHRLRPGERPGSDPDHARRPRCRRVRPGLDARRLRPDRRAGPLGGPRLPRGELLAAHPLRGVGLRDARARAESHPAAPPQLRGPVPGVRGAGPGRRRAADPGLGHPPRPIRRHHAGWIRGTDGRDPVSRPGAGG